VQPSSLVFLVIIAVWAAYFVQYWVRRREHLATARSVDQFSESMRVLERRSPLPSSNLSTPQPRSYAVTPARVARPQVLVKHAAPISVAMPAAPEAVPAKAPAATRTKGSPARRTRAVIMLGALTTLVITGPLVALSVLPVLTLLVPVAAIGVAVVWARSTALAERRSRQTSRPGRAGRSHSSQSRPSRGVPGPAVAQSGSRAVARAVPRAVPHAAGDPAAAVETQPEVAAKPELFDVQAQSEDVTVAAAVTPEVSTAMRPLVDEDDIPLTWDPVPVPRPTYAMKSRVTRPAPTSADLVGDADTEYAAYDEVPERRVAGA
jgi:membrane protein implicated in regulation of membrane protease activity